jgi:hypothetical protein
MAQRDRNQITLLPKQRLLITESADEFDALREAFEREIRPRGIIERMYVADISSIVWEILRLRRCKVVIVNTGFRRAGLPAQCGSSLQRNDAGVWLCEYPGPSFQRCPVRACSLVSSLLLNGATMSQESSLTHSSIF